MQKLILLAFASLAISAYAIPPTVINSVPYIIRNPGTYMLNADLSVPAGVTGIQISTVATGPITLDLKGHTLMGSGGADGAGISVGDINGPGETANAYPITIKDGTVTGFSFAVFVQISTGNGSNAWANDVTVSHLTINTPNAVQDSAGVYFREVNNSIIKGCTFTGGTYGIEDSQSQGGNSYLNCTFTNLEYPILTQQGAAGGSLTTTVGHYESVATPAN
jgi:hypothetical protein